MDEILHRDILSCMKIASAQLNVEFNDVPANVQRALQTMNEVSAQGVELVVFPECFLTGYCAQSCEDAISFALDLTDFEGTAESLPPQIRELQATVDRLQIAIIVGAATRTGDQLFNSAFFLRPSESPAIYHKTHLPELGFDKYAQPGNELKPFDYRGAKIGILICFDMRYPESARTLTLLGADIIAIPTNWPTEAVCSADVISVARAAENRVFVVTCDRVGSERGFNFIGRSKIISPTGVILASAGSEENTLIQDLQLSQARQKRTVTIPDQYETDVVGCRQPGLYAPITHP